MIIQPKVRGFICTTAHPDGCRAHVQEWIDYVQAQGALSDSVSKANLPKKVLIIGSSTGFGLASRIVAAFGAGAKTIGVAFEKPADEKRTASPGWYNTAAFEQAAAQKGLYAKSINGDAFSTAIKDEVVELIKQDWGGEVDLVIYSIASPRRTHPITQETFSSVLKPIGKSFQNKTVDVMSGQVTQVSLNPASDEEIAATVAVMGGEDWQFWMERLAQEGLLAKGVKTVAFTYIGPQLTHDIYRNGTIGKAKEHLESSARAITQHLSYLSGQAIISVNKALVTQASAAIPVVPLYIALLYKVMKAKGLHEGCIEQMYRLFNERLFASEIPVDESGRIRIDDWEMRDDIQSAVAETWNQVTSDNLAQLGDLPGYLAEFYKLFGFGFSGVDYDKDADPKLKIPSIDN
jgi:enoyl-[acyl-carrier protein] reductase/trans-2-enoyl-CoA reductase (NAD+)